MAIVHAYRHLQINSLLWFKLWFNPGPIIWKESFAFEEIQGSSLHNNMTSSRNSSKNGRCFKGSVSTKL